MTLIENGLLLGGIVDLAVEDHFRAGGFLPGQ